MGHGDDLYSTSDVERVGWYEPVPTTLDDVVETLGDPADGRSIVDVGAGASRMVDHLLDRGYHDITLVDISSEGLEHTSGRLGDRSSSVVFAVADVTQFTPARRFDLWHDRAAFHFLTNASDRRRYVDALERSLIDDGVAIVATFGPDGPQMCAGLPVKRYDAEALAHEFAPNFRCVSSREYQPGQHDSDKRPYTICRFARSR